MKQLNSIKDEIQREAHAIWVSSGRQGTIAAGTGFGKSRIPILEAKRMADAGILTQPNEILLVTPTEKLRDENWPNEFKDWGEEKLFNQHVEAICFASLKKYRNSGRRWKLIILDEIHRLTELSASAFKEDDEDTLTEFLAENIADAVIGLTATIPDHKRDPEKFRIIAQIAPVVFTYSLDQGVADGMIADYEIKVIECHLDALDKYIPGGTKDKPFLTTEFGHYTFLEKKIKKFRSLAHSTGIASKAASFEKLAMLTTMERNRFIYGCRSKTLMAKRCIKAMRQQGPDKRRLIFCGGIEQCNDLLGDNVFHSKTNSDAYTAFNLKQINELGVVNAANEGINFIDLDEALIVQLDSNPRNLVQRIGRLLRVREGHKAVIYILILQGTADERWLEKCLVEFDKSKVSYYSSKSVPA